MAKFRFLVPSRAWAAAFGSAISDRISLVAAGCAFYAMLALFPSVTLTILVYGLWFDLESVEPQLALLDGVLPEDAASLIADRVRDLVSAPRAQLGLGAAMSAAVALWSASAGIRALLGALSMAYGREERRGFLAFYATALLLTVGTIVALALGLGLSVLLLPLLGLAGGLGQAATIATLYVLALLFIGLLYRFGPDSPPPGWRLFSPGAVVAATLWAVLAAGFSFYVTHYASYDALYGALGTAIALLTWLYLGVYLILLGAELDAAAHRLRHAPEAPAAPRPKRRDAGPGGAGRLARRLGFARPGGRG